MFLKIAKALIADIARYALKTGDDDITNIHGL